MEDQEISEFIRDIGKKIEEVSGVKLNFPQVPEEEWISEDEMITMKSKGIYLRTAKQTKNMETVKLKLFNPCIVYEDLKHGGKEHPSIPCRVPGCPETTPIKKPACSGKTRIKQDLFLCKTHLASLMVRVSKRCTEENVAVDITSIKNDDLKGYTSLIGVLEKAFIHLTSKWLPLSTIDSLRAEVFLNTRNFLIITNALLNPDEDNEITALNPYLRALLIFLRNPNAHLVLREIKALVLSAFGVIDRWVYLTNPGGQIGGGTGLILGFLAGTMAVQWTRSSRPLLMCPFAVALPFVGFFGGSEIGRGVYEWWRKKKLMKEYSLLETYSYHVFTNAAGDIRGGVNY